MENEISKLNAIIIAKNDILQTTTNQLQSIKEELKDCSLEIIKSKEHITNLEKEIAVQNSREKLLIEKSSIHSLKRKSSTYDTAMILYHPKKLKNIPEGTIDEPIKICQIYGSYVSPDKYCKLNNITSIKNQRKDEQL